jgi:hypothetical protein
MPVNKDQHFVPKVHLKNFACDVDKNCVHSIFLKSNRPILGISIKGQCQKSYLYGQDVSLDRSLQAMEAKYGCVMADLLQRDVITEENFNFLLEFSYLQFSRSYGQVKRRQSNDAAVHKSIYSRPMLKKPELDIDDKKTMEKILRTYSKTRESLSGLSTCLVQNRTNTDFITSDDPAILTNLYFLEILKENKFGLESSGILLILPLSSQFLFLAYDENVYDIPDMNQRVLTIIDIEDIYAFNELQLINAQHNIYFEDANQEATIQTLLEQVKHHRMADRNRIVTLIETRKVQGKTLVRYATEKEKLEAKKLIIGTSFLYPAPNNWCKKIKIKEKPLIFGDGSMAGPMRKPIQSSKKV